MQVSDWPFSIAVAIAVFVCNSAVGADESNTTNSLQLATIKEPMMGRDPITRAYVTSGAKKFTFIVPAGFRVDGSKPDEIVLTSGDFSCFITLRVIGPAMGAKSGAAETYRASVLSRYPDTQIGEEHSLSAAGCPGPAFDLRGKTAEGLVRSSRIAFIPCGGQVLEFCLVASPEKFNVSLTELQSVMLTFRASDADGKIDIAVLSERI